MKRLVGAAVFALSCSASTGARAPTPPRKVIISLIGTNDVHGRLDRLPWLAGYVDNLRATRRSDGAVLLVDAGDAFQGTLESTLDEGAGIVRAYNVMGYSAMSLGNHEFDFGPVGDRSIPAAGDDPFGALEARLREARFPVLSANLQRADGTPPNWQNLHPSTLVPVAGMHVGLVGVITADAAHVIKRPNFEGLHTTPLAAALIRESRALRQRGADAVIAIAHAGGHCDAVDSPRNLSSCEPHSEIFEVAHALPPGTVDAIVAGHRSEAVAHFVGGVPIVQSPTGLVAFSRIDLTFDADTRQLLEARIHPPRALCEPPASDECRPSTYEGAPVRQDPRVAAAVAPSLRQARDARSRKLGIFLQHAMTPYKRRECPMGNLFVDLMRGAVPGADGAFSNGGSLRAALPEGELTYGQLHRAMPFDNQVATVSLTGAQLRAIIANNVSQKQHGILSVSGIRARVACDEQGTHVSLTREDEHSIADDERLLMVTSDFMAMGGDGLLEHAGVDLKTVTIDPSKKVRDVLIEGLRARERWDPTDTAIFDEAHPRIQLPGGALPVRCDRKNDSR